MSALFPNMERTRSLPAGVICKDERDKESESNSDRTFDDEKLRSVSWGLPRKSKERTHRHPRIP